MKKIFLILFLFSISSFSHDIEHLIKKHNDVIEIDFYFSDGTKFSYQSYEIYSSEDKKIPYQVGRTDKNGRVLFFPEKGGEWEVKVFSDDGHGKNVILNFEGNKKIEEKNLSLYSKFGKIITGVSLIIGIFGILSLFFRRKR